MSNYYESLKTFGIPSDLPIDGKLAYADAIRDIATAIAIAADAEIEGLRKLLELASETIDGLSDQQAMEDLWYVEPWERIKAAIDAAKGAGDE